jgi:DNA-directed RNA polymerase subunit M/transcription elongation factor TFIIS
MSDEYSNILRDKYVGELENSGIIRNNAIEIEIGTFNWTIDYCMHHDIIRNWQNYIFRKIYMNKCVSILDNLVRLSASDIPLREYAYQPHSIIYPELWSPIIDKLNKQELESNKLDIGMGITTNVFKCGKCKKNNCMYLERWARSLDEPAVTYITCLECGNKWRQ